MTNEAVKFRQFFGTILPYAEPDKDAPVAVRSAFFADPIMQSAQALCMAIDEFANTSFSDADLGARAALHAATSKFIRVYSARHGAAEVRKMPESVRFLARGIEPAQAQHNMAKAIHFEARRFSRAPKSPPPKTDDVSAPASGTRAAPVSSRGPRAQVNVA